MKHYKNVPKRTLFETFENRFMQEKILLLFFGITAILLNKYLRRGAMWWEKEVMKSRNRDQWFYRILIGY